MPSIHAYSCGTLTLILLQVITFTGAPDTNTVTLSTVGFHSDRNVRKNPKPSKGGGFPDTVTTLQEVGMAIRNDNNFLLAAGATTAHGATFGPGSQLVATFTAKPNSSDLIFFFDNDVATLTGSPVFTTSIYDGQTLLGTATTAP